MKPTASAPVLRQRATWWTKLRCRVLGHAEADDSAIEYCCRCGAMMLPESELLAELYSKAEAQNFLAQNLPDTLAARLEVVHRMIEQGLISAEQAVKLLEAVL